MRDISPKAQKTLHIALFTLIGVIGIIYIANESGVWGGVGWAALLSAILSVFAAIKTPDDDPRWARGGLRVYIFKLVAAFSALIIIGTSIIGI